jgi:hypothetical protein
MVELTQFTVVRRAPDGCRRQGATLAGRCSRCRGDLLLTGAPHRPPGDISRLLLDFGLTCRPYLVNPFIMIELVVGGARTWRSEDYRTSFQLNSTYD